jgi:hypothetical protein
MDLARRHRWPSWLSTSIYYGNTPTEADAIPGGINGRVPLQKGQLDAGLPDGAFLGQHARHCLPTTIGVRS